MKRLISIAVSAMLVISSASVVAFAQPGDAGTSVPGNAAPGAGLTSSLSDGSNGLYSSSASSTEFTQPGGSSSEQQNTSGVGDGAGTVSSFASSSEEEPILTSSSETESVLTSSSAASSQRMFMSLTLPTTSYDVTYQVVEGEGSIVIDGVSYSGSGVAKSVPAGTEITISVQPGEGYSNGWISVGGQNFSGGAYTTGENATAICAGFTKQESSSSEESSSSSESSSSEQEQSYTVSFAGTYDGGSISLSVDGKTLHSGDTVKAGDTISVSVTEDTGFELAALTANGNDILSSRSYTVGNDSQDAYGVAITAAFRSTAQEVTRTILFNTPENGSLTATYDGKTLSSGDQVPDGAQVTFTATPADGYAVALFHIGGESYTTGSVTVTASKDLAAYVSFAYAANTLGDGSYDLTVPENPSNGTVTVKYQASGASGWTTLTKGSTVSVSNGDKLTVTATPDDDYQLSTFQIVDGGENYASGQTSAYSKTFVVDSQPSITVAFSKIVRSGSEGLVTQPLGVYDEDGDPLEDNEGDAFDIYDISSNGRITLDGVLPGQTFYIKLGSVSNDLVTYLDCYDDDGHYAYASQLADNDLFKISIDKDGSGKSLISSITQVSEKRLGDSARGSYLKVVLKDSTTTDELKASAEITFKAKKTLSTGDTVWDAGDTATLNLVMWINNSEVSGSDGDADTGDSVYFDPDSNEYNTFIWGDDRAALEFYADDSADSFYARLSTKADVDIYTEYGDPVDADLYFYDFVGNPTVPSTSRAALTLGIPWDEDDDDAPDPEDCYLYQLDSDGYLTDVTDRFTYSEDDYEIPGWTIKTRVLGTYILSDTELEIDVYDYEVDTGYDDEDDNVEDESETLVKVNPSTGGGDYYTPITMPANYSATTAGLTTTDGDTAEDGDDVAQARATTAVPAAVPSVSEDTAQRQSAPWFGIILTVVLLAGAGAAGYLLYRQIRMNRES